MNLLQDFEQLVLRAACDVGGRLPRAFHELWRLWPMSSRTGTLGSAIASSRQVFSTVPRRTVVEQSRSPQGNSRGMHADLQPDHRNLTRGDVELIWQMRRADVISALRNFAAVRFIRMPVHGAVGWEIETPFRDVVNVVGARQDLSKRQRAQVYYAVLIAFVTLPLGMSFPSPFGIVEELDQIIDDAPEIRAAVQEVWSTVDDQTFWMAVGRRHMQLAAV